MASARYLYTNQYEHALERLKALERIEDSFTVTRMLDIGVGRGWVCLEVGAGAGSMAAWLSERVGDTGRVVATDVDVGFLDPSRYEVWRHDIREDDLPSAMFDLVHVRHTLMHIPDTEHTVVLAKIRRALKPGGVALIEESDFSTWKPKDKSPVLLADAYATGVNEILSLYRRRGMDVCLGRNLPSLLERAGFRIGSMSAEARDVEGGSSEATFHQLSFRQLRESTCDVEPLDASVIDAFLLCFDNPALQYRTRTTIAVSASRPD